MVTTLIKASVLALATRADVTNLVTRIYSECRDPHQVPSSVLSQTVTEGLAPAGILSSNQDDSSTKKSAASHSQTHNILDTCQAQCKSGSNYKTSTCDVAHGNTIRTTFSQTFSIVTINHNTDFTWTNTQTLTSETTTITYPNSETKETVTTQEFYRDYINTGGLTDNAHFITMTTTYTTTL